MQIQWYPGHMAKARRMLEENLKLIDVVVELVDARAPLATRNPDFDALFSQKSRVILLNKSDLASAEQTKKHCQNWRQYPVVTQFRMMLQLLRNIWSRLRYRNFLMG